MYNIIYIGTDLLHLVCQSGWMMFPVLLQTQLFLDVAIAIIQVTALILKMLGYLVLVVIKKIFSTCLRPIPCVGIILLCCVLTLQ